MDKNNKKSVNHEKSAFVVAQDMKLVRALASNDKKYRDRALKSLRKWFKHRSYQMPFSETDYMRIWKGLFYAMWMSDKPLIQEECAENIASLIHSTTPESSLCFFKCGFVVLGTEWFGIDRWRLDKFLMLVRRVLRQGLQFLKNNNWEIELIQTFNQIISQTVLKKEKNRHLGFTMHIIEIYLEELAKVSEGKLDKGLTTQFLKPFIMYLSMLNEERQIKHIIKFMFHHLFDQSDPGLEYHAKLSKWRDLGFPGGNLNALQKVEDDEENEEDDDVVENGETALDARAGLVDVALPQLKFDASEALLLVRQHKFHKESTTKGRKAITRLENEFEQVARGNYPLGFKKIKTKAKQHYINYNNAFNDLAEFEETLKHDTIKNRKNNNIGEDINKEKLDNIDFFANKLEEFVRKSEGKRKATIKRNKHKKLKIKNDPNWRFEEQLEQNSGVWLVHRENTLEGDSSTSMVTDKTDDTISNNLVHSTPKPPKINNSLPIKVKTPKSTEVNNKPLTNGFKDSPELKSNLFPQKEWDCPPNEGEVEIFVPSNKFKKKMELKAKQQGKTLTEVLDTTLKTLAKTRYSLNITEPKINKFIPRSEKKVKIDLKLNRSQDIQEHQAQLKSSPGIPFDANKKPTKPLLKSNLIKSPINPFYKRKLKLL